MKRLIKFVLFALMAFVSLMQAQTVSQLTTSSSTTLHVYLLGPVYLTGINNNGVIVGYSGDGRSFTWSNGVFTYFQVPGSNFTQALGINDAGQVFGTYGNNNFPFPGFLYDGQNFTTVEYPGAQETKVTAVLKSGMVLGYFNNSPTIDGFRFDGTEYRAFLIPGKQIVTTITGAANNNGDFVGSAATINYEGYVFSRGKITLLNFPGALTTGASGINDSGVVTGNFEIFGSGESCFYWQAGRFVSFNIPGAAALSACNGINNAGVIVGWYQDSGGGIHGFVTSPIPTEDSSIGSNPLTGGGNP